MKRSPGLRPRGIPLYGQLLLWLALNLALIAALFVALPGRSGLGWNALLTEPVRERLLAIGERMARDLAKAPRENWERTLQQWDTADGVHFTLGPRSVMRLRTGGGVAMPGPPPPGAGPFVWGAPPGPPAGAPPPQFGEPPLQLQPGPDGLRSKMAELVAVSRLPGRDGYAVRIPALISHGDAPEEPVEIIAQVPSLRAMLAFLGVTDWVAFAALVVAASALLWWPFVWRISRTVVQLTRATQRIAEGRFDVRVASRRRDELGLLADSVNLMAHKLERFVAGQKQFVADVAHEVTSPLLRLRLGLGVLEPRLDQDSRQALREVEDDAQQMSDLLHELMLFSRAGMDTGPAAAVPVELAALAAEVLRREDPARRVRADLPAGLKALAQPAMLQRALANLVRNALRYGGDAAAVELVAEPAPPWLRLAVRDRGPGVAPAALPRLGEPFFRPEAARSRDSGGFGLGLAIVRRCVEACGGEVSFRNRDGGGFEAEIRLRPA